VKAKYFIISRKPCLPAGRDAKSAKKFFAIFFQQEIESHQGFVDDKRLLVIKNMMLIMLFDKLKL